MFPRALPLMGTENFHQVPLKRISKIYCTIFSTGNYKTENYNYWKALAVMHKTRTIKLNLSVLFPGKAVA